MGCDIHAYIESVYSGQDGAPDLVACVAVLDIDRDYCLFGALADVRNRCAVKCPYPPKGLPVTELSYQVHGGVKMWRDDMHSASWLTARELEEVLVSWRDTQCSVGDYTHHNAQIEGILAHMEALDEHYDRYRYSRLVFWFDS